MFNIIKNKLIIYSLAVGILITFVFGCALAAQTTIANSQHSNMIETECCDVNIYSSFSSTTHNLPYILSNSSFSQFILLLSVSLAFLLLFIYFNNSASGNYYRSIRDRYGGFKLFYKFTLLFSEGLIHPKIF